MEKKDLWKLRQEIVLNSLYTNDYVNSFGINEQTVQDFFDSYIEELNWLLEEKVGVEEIEKMNSDKYYSELFKLDNEDNLYNYYYSCEDVGF